MLATSSPDLIATYCSSVIPLALPPISSTHTFLVSGTPELTMALGKLKETEMSEMSSGA